MDFNQKPISYAYMPTAPSSILPPINTGFMGQDIIDVPLLTGGTNSSALPSSIFNYMQQNKPQSLLTTNTLGRGVTTPNTGGFFKNGNDLGFNLDTANFAMNGLTGIMQLWGANTQRKAIQAQMDIAKENMRMTKLGYDTNIEKRAMAAANFNGYGPEGMRTAGNAALGRYGSGLLQPRELSPAKRNDEPVAATA